jgi:hypothetical protein
MADIAFVRFLTRVTYPVPAQTFLIEETFVTRIASVRLLSGMSHLVALHIAELGEGLAADVTGVRPGTGMNPFVNV